MLKNTYEPTWQLIEQRWGSLKIFLLRLCGSAVFMDLVEFWKNIPTFIFEFRDVLPSLYDPQHDKGDYTNKKIFWENYPPISYRGGAGVLRLGRKEKIRRMCA